MDIHNENAAIDRGGLHINWKLGDDPRPVNTKAGPRTIVELRDPSRLSRSIVLWLDIAPEDLPAVKCGSYIALRLNSANPSQFPGQLTGDVDTQALIAAFASAVPGEEE